MGARRLAELFERYEDATVRACFDIVDTTEAFRRGYCRASPRHLDLGGLRRA